jgi:hypothetical protein
MTKPSTTAASGEIAEAGAPEIEITAEMIEAGKESRLLYPKGALRRPTSAETRSLLESIPVEFEPGQLEFDLPKEILEVAAEIADVSDVVGLERARLERLVRVVIAMDRAREDRSLLRLHCYIIETIDRRRSILHSGCKGVRKVRLGLLWLIRFGQLQL